MQIGVVYPQTEIPTDPQTIRTYIARVEELGFRHVLIFEHVLGADPLVHTDWRGPYDVDSTFHEPFVFYGFLAALTTMELVTGIVASPQRQTALLAKQAAEVDILAEGRFRLGLGVGWNAVEYDALDQDFTTRGQRQVEQIGLLRRLWTERTVNHAGRFDRVTGAGLAPLPVQRPIPIWLGGQSVATYRRIGMLADGWFPVMQPGSQLAEAQRIVDEAAERTARDPHAIGLEGRIRLQAGKNADLLAQTQGWEAARATHLSFNTMGSGLHGLDEHLQTLSYAAESLQLSDR